jgi:hypothetical protein
VEKIKLCASQGGKTDKKKKDGGAFSCITPWATFRLLGLGKRR